MTTDRNHAIVAEVTALAAEVGVTAAQLALAWITGRPHISSVILGPRTAAQLEDNLAGMDLELPDRIRHRLDVVSAPTNTPVTGAPIPQPS